MTCIFKSFKSNWCVIQIKAYLSTGGVTNSYKGFVRSHKKAINVITNDN